MSPQDAVFRCTGGTSDRYSRGSMTASARQTTAHTACNSSTDLRDVLQKDKKKDKKTNKNNHTTKGHELN